MAVESTVVAEYRFRGFDYHVTLVVGDRSVTKGQTMTVEVEDRATADRWKGVFAADYVQELTQKTGNYKQFDVFVSMMESALTKSSDSVTLDLLTYADLQKLRNQKSVSNPPASESLTSKRYLILTYSVEFDRIHYPMPLPYLGKPDPVALLQTIRDLRLENDELKRRLTLESTFTENDYEKRLEEAMTKNQELEDRVQELTSELAVFREGRASKEIRMLKGVVESMESDLMKEKNRHQRSADKARQESRSLREQIETLRSSESDLKFRVKNLVAELSSYKRASVALRPRNSPSPRPGLRNSLDSRPSRSLTRTSSGDRTVQQPARSSSRGGGGSLFPRERTSSIERFARRRTASGEMKSERAPPAPRAGQSATRLSDQSSTRWRSTKDRSRTRLSGGGSAANRSPSPVAPFKRFNPTEYVKQKKAKERDRDRRVSSEKRYRLGSGGGTGGVKNSNALCPKYDATSSRSRGLMSASPQEIGSALRRRTSSGESLASNSRTSSVESLCSQRSHERNRKSSKLRKTSPVRTKVNANANSYLKPKDSNRSAAGAVNNKSAQATISPTVKSLDKENLPAEDSLNDTNDVSAAVEDVGNDLSAVSFPADHEDEMAEIDARLNALQSFMKSIGHE